MGQLTNPFCFLSEKKGRKKKIKFFSHTPPQKTGQAKQDLDEDDEDTPQELQSWH
jgi:hypothetical protein